MSAPDQFLSAMEAAGLAPPGVVHGDGKLHRFSPTGRCGDDAGWYVLHLDSVSFGAFGDCRSGELQYWCSKTEDDLSDAERQTMHVRAKAVQQLREVEEARMRGESVPNALAMLEGAASADTRPCPAAESVRPRGVGADLERQ